MQVHFRTKEESNRAQEEEFLKLSGAERVYAFFDLIRALKDFPSKANEEEEQDRKKQNFQIIINTENWDNDQK